MHARRDWSRRMLPVLLVALLTGCTPFWARQPSPTPAPRVTCPPWVDSSAAPSASSTGPAPSSGDLAAQAQDNARRVLETPHPIRSLYRITQLLVTHQRQPIACFVRGSPRNERVGQRASFYVINPGPSGYHQISATLVYETAHLYMYVQQGASADPQAIRASADRFESATYPKDRATFGSQWATGPDDDPHITVLTATNLGPLGGYFSSEDEYPRAVFPYSNERQMIYLNLAGGAVPGTSFYDAALAHEFQHMIHWYWRPGDDSWTNEGMSVLAQHLNGYTTNGVDLAFLQRPDTMLGGWTDNADENVYHYGAGYLFMEYFATHAGGYPVLQALLTDPAPLPLNFDDVLAHSGSSARFDDIFANFVLANLLNDPAVASGLYAYPDIPGERAKPQHAVSAYPYADGTTASPATIHQYAAQYYDFTPTAGGAKTLTLTFHGDPYTRIVANTPYNGAQAEWWSNSGDNMDSALTRSFDLTALAGQPVTLNFAAWYNLEPDFDYAYVEVSTDGGHNWTALPATTSTMDNPNGANFGNGITGTSGQPGVQDCGTAPQWVPETVDLSAYPGKRIQVRFETITDDAVHCPGFAIDDLRIPQLGFADKVASDNGWQAQGWLRSNNVLPERWVLQAVVYSAGQSEPTIETIPVDSASGTARVAFAGFGGTLTRVELAVTAMAPATIVPAPYQLTASLQP